MRSRGQRSGWWSALVVGTLLAMTPARAQEPGKLPGLTLEQAVAKALKQNPAFAISEDDADAARARLKQVQAAWYPRLDFEQNFTRGNNPVYVFGTKLTQRQFSEEDFALNNLNTPTPFDNFQTRFDAQWRLFDSGQTLYHQRAAKKLVTTADFQTEQARQDLIYEVVQSYYAIRVAEENVKAAENAVKTAGASLQRLEAMRTAGTVVDSDYLSAKVFLAQMKDREIRARNDLATVEMQLARIMGTPVETRMELAGALGEPKGEGKALDEWLRTALSTRPALRAAELQEHATDDERKAAKAEFGPKIALFGSAERDAMTMAGPSGTNWTAGARLDINVFAGGAQKARLAEATANANKAKHGVEWLRSGITMEVRSSYLQTEAAEQRAAAAHGSAEQATESLRIVKNRYEAGLTTITELLRAETSLLDAQTLYLSALQDWQVSLAQLERAAGVLTPESALIANAGGR